MANLMMLPPIKGGKADFRQVERIAINDEVVLTSAQVAEFYGCSSDSIKKNFNANKDRFIEGKHYFKLEGDTLQEFKNRVTDSYLVGKNANTLYLWTRKGVLRHCKMLKTDKAWEVFEKMEDTFFRVGASDFEKIQKVFQKELENLEREASNCKSERLRLECERRNLEYALNNLRDAEDDKNIAKAKVLNDLANSATNDDLRNDLIRQAAKLLLREDSSETTANPTL